MSNYGRNFEFRVAPRGGHRAGRVSLGGSTELPIGAPVVVTGDEDELGRLELALASEGAAVPAPGQGGIILFEHAPNAFSGDDPSLVLYSDKGNVPVGKGCQLINGDYVKVVLRNTADRTFLQVRDYEGRNLVDPAAVGATPAKVGDGLVPGKGNDTDGYWKVAGVSDEPWLVITKVDTNRGEIEARLTF